MCVFFCFLFIDQNDGGHQEVGASFSMNHVLYNIEADEVNSEKVVSMVAKLKNPDVFTADVRLLTLNVLIECHSSLYFIPLKITVILNRNK